jgi:hypothetical protein
MPAQWSEIEALVKPWFDAGQAPERGDLMDLAFEKDASDDVIDALDTLGSRPITSLDELKELLTKAGALA